MKTIITLMLLLASCTDHKVNNTVKHSKDSSVAVANYKLIHGNSKYEIRSVITYSNDTPRKFRDSFFPIQNDSERISIYVHYNYKQKKLLKDRDNTPAPLTPYYCYIDTTDTYIPF
jgi:hypothetical protein